MVESAQHRVGQAIVKNLPTPPSHPLRNYNPEMISRLMANPNFQVDTQGMTPEQYGQYLSDITGKAIIDFQRKSSDPESALSKAQQVDLASRLGSQGSSMRFMQVPGVPSTEPGSGAAGYFAPQGLRPGVATDFASAMGRQSLAESDAVILSPLANDTTLRHELFHRGVEKLKNRGLDISQDDEEMVARIFDYKLGSEKDKEIVAWYWDKYYDMKPEEILRNKYFMDLVDRVQEEAFKEMGGVPIPDPTMPQRSK
jgi:hypothetical protein